MKKLCGAIAVLIAGIAPTTNPVRAITDGGFDTNGHPYVGLMVAQDATERPFCFGDSGGPNFVGTSNVVGGVRSFGLNGACEGTGGVYRVDRQDHLAWLTTLGVTP